MAVWHCHDRTTGQVRQTLWSHRSPVRAGHLTVTNTDDPPLALSQLQEAAATPGISMRTMVQPIVGGRFVGCDTLPQKRNS
jgi:hypothetical protein